jgi:hypothetical protein
LSDGYAFDYEALRYPAYQHEVKKYESPEAKKNDTGDFLLESKRRW